MNPFPAHAQEAFDAASIKPNNSGARAGGVRSTPGRVIGVNATAKSLLQWAFNVRGYQISGGPNWLEADGFDVEAKTDGGATENRLRPMLQNLLVERFKLAAHRSTREMQVSALMVAKSGLKAHEVKAGDPAPLPPPPPKEGGGSFIFVTGQMADLGACFQHRWEFR